MSKTLTKKDICLKYGIKAQKLDYHIKKVVTKRNPMPFPKGTTIKGLRHFKESEVEKYAAANKTFSKPSHKELGMAEAADFTVTHDTQFENKMWEAVAPEPWHARHKYVLWAVIGGVTAAIVGILV